MKKAAIAYPNHDHSFADRKLSSEVLLRLQANDLISKIRSSDVTSALKIISESPDIALLKDERSPGCVIHMACVNGAREVVQQMIKALPDKGRWVNFSSK